MKETRDIIRGYATDLLAVHRHSLEAIKRHANDDDIAKIPGARDIVAQAIAVLEGNMNRLESRLAVLGGQGASGQIKEAVTTATGFLVGLYGQARGEPASRALRDDYAAMSFVLVCTTMLHATARALRDMDTAAVTSAMMHDLPPVIVRLADIVPQAVVAELAIEHGIVDGAADEMTIREIKETWRAASAPA